MTRSSERSFHRRWLWNGLALFTLSISGVSCGADHSTGPVVNESTFFDPRTTSPGSGGSPETTGGAGGTAGSSDVGGEGGGEGGDPGPTGGFGGSEGDVSDAAVGSGRADAGRASGGTGGRQADAAAQTGDAATATGSPGCQQVSFTVTVHGSIGGHSPKNIGAIWISDGAGKFVKTLRVWANTRKSHLTDWASATGKNAVDAVTSATINSEGARAATWNCADASGKPVASGTYRVNVEWSEDNDPGDLMKPIEFAVGAGAVTLTPPDQSSLKSIRLQVMPNP